MAKAITLRVGDTAPNLPITCTYDDGSVVDLSGATVRFKISNSDTGTRTNDAHNSCSVTSATGGLCTYDLAAGDIPSAGTYYGDTEVTFGTGEVQTQKQSQILVVLAKN